MYDTTLQFDVLFRLKELTGNYELTFEDAKNLNEDILEKFFHDVITFSIIGIFQYHPYRTYREDKGKYSPTQFAWDWFCDIFDYEKDIDAKRVFKKVIREYYDVTHFNRYCQPMNGENNLIVFSSLEKLKKYALDSFDMEAMYQYGVMNEEKYTNLFDKNKKYYALDDNVIIKTYSYDELFDCIKDKFEHCVFFDEGYLLIYTDNVQRKIVAEDYFNNLKTIEEYLDIVKFEELDKWQIKCLINRFGEANVYHHKNIYKYLDKVNPLSMDWVEAEIICNMNYVTNQQLRKWIKKFIKSPHFISLINLIKDCKDVKMKYTTKSILLDCLIDYIGG